MCNKYEADQLDFLDLKSINCPHCGSLTSAIRFPNKPIKFENVTIKSWRNLRICLPCWTETYGPPVTTVDRKILFSVIKQTLGGEALVFTVEGSILSI